MPRRAPTHLNSPTMCVRSTGALERSELTSASPRVDAGTLEAAMAHLDAAEQRACHEFSERYMRHMRMADRCARRRRTLHHAPRLARLCLLRAACSLRVRYCDECSDRRAVRGAHYVLSRNIRLVSTRDDLAIDLESVTCDGVDHFEMLSDERVLRCVAAWASTQRC